MHGDSVLCNRFGHYVLRLTDYVWAKDNHCGFCYCSADTHCHTSLLNLTDIIVIIIIIIINCYQLLKLGL